MQYTLHKYIYIYIRVCLYLSLFPKSVVSLSKLISPFLTFSTLHASPYFHPHGASPHKTIPSSPPCLNYPFAYNRLASDCVRRNPTTKPFKCIPWNQSSNYSKETGEGTRWSGVETRERNKCPD